MSKIVRKKNVIDMIDFSDFSILFMDENSRIPLKGKYSTRLLADILIENWIGFEKCSKCSRSDYCKYVQRFSDDPKYLKEIKCGVVKDCIQNLVEVTFPILIKLNRKNVQNFLDGAFYYIKFINEAEFHIGWSADPGFFNYYSNSISLFGQVCNLREYLNKVGFYWNEIPGFQINRPILFVEGETEKAYLNEMKKSHLSQFLRLQIESYEGKGNRKSKKIDQLLRHLKKLGYKLYISGDADGAKNVNFQTLMNSGVTDKFVFKHDFETSIPVDILYYVLLAMNLLNDKNKNEFLNSLGDEDISVIKKLNKNSNIDISKYKVEFGKTLARLLNESGFYWWCDKEFMQTELGKFLFFIQSINDDLYCATGDEILKRQLNPCLDEH